MSADERPPLDVDASPIDLRWADVDPAAWPAPPDLAVRAFDVAVDVLLGVARDEDQIWRARAESELARAFARSFGVWTLGWRWACDEGSIGGGVVGAWCCPRHSLLPPEEKNDVEPTARRATDALLEWRKWLETLQATFAVFPLPTLAGDEDDDVLEAIGRAQADVLDRACAALVNLVVEHTGAGDAWYVLMRQVLAWYLEHAGADADDAIAAADEAIRGRFTSWVGPDDLTLNAVCVDWTDHARRALDRATRARTGTGP